MGKCWEFAEAQVPFPLAGKGLRIGNICYPDVTDLENRVGRGGAILQDSPAFLNPEFPINVGRSGPLVLQIARPG
jgi:hypothetical protein